MIFECVEMIGLSVYSPHTALDNVKGGINDWLASGLGQGTTECIKRYNENGNNTVMTVGI